MIDTDKYEGHDTGWKAHFFCDGSIAIGGVCKLLTEETGHKTRKMIEANALLIQDAPVLLAEVKRLRKDRDLIWDAIRLSGTGGHQEEEIAFWHEKLLNMNEAELKEAFKGHYEDVVE